MSGSQSTPNLSGPLGMLPLPNSNPPISNTSSNTNSNNSSNINASNNVNNGQNYQLIYDPNNGQNHSLDMFAAPRQPQQQQPQPYLSHPNYSYATLSRHPSQLFHLQQSTNSYLQYHSPLPQPPQLIEPPPLHDDSPHQSIHSSHSSNTLSSAGSMNSISSINDDIDTSQSTHSSNSPITNHVYQLNRQKSVDGSPDNLLHDLSYKNTAPKIVKRTRRKSSTYNLRKGFNNTSILPPIPPIPALPIDIVVSEHKPMVRNHMHKIKFTPEDDELLINLKEVRQLSWRQIAEHFDGRTAGALQVRYCTKLKQPKPSSWSEEDVNSLRAIVQHYESEKWEVISERFGHKYSPELCREKYRELSRRDYQHRALVESYSNGDLLDGTSSSSTALSLPSPPPQRNITSIPMMHNNSDHV